MVISVKDKEINSGPWKNISVDSHASLLHPLPLPLGGLVAIGYQTIAYYDKDVLHAIDSLIVKVQYTCVCVHTMYTKCRNVRSLYACGYQLPTSAVLAKEHIPNSWKLWQYAHP